MFEGRIEAIALRRMKSGEVQLVEEAMAEAERGLVGDHAIEGLPPHLENAPENQVTLIEAEAIEAVRNENGLELSHAQSRRNLLTRGVPLNHLVGKQFFVGPVLLEGRELCEPCGHLEKLTNKKLVSPFLHRCGLRARIVEGGVLKVGDAVKDA